jgi:hypothetical protein
MTKPLWPRRAYCCIAPNCGYVRAYDTTMPPMCPAHGTVLTLTLIEPTKLPPTTS